MIHPHATIERLARQICDEANGSGHFDAPRTHRHHWRKRASRLLAAQAAGDIPPLIQYLLRSAGWVAP